MRLNVAVLIFIGQAVAGEEFTCFLVAIPGLCCGQQNSFLMVLEIPGLADLSNPSLSCWPKLS